MTSLAPYPLEGNLLQLPCPRHQPTNPPSRCLTGARLVRLEYLPCVAEIIKPFLAISSHGKQRGFHRLGFREHRHFSARLSLCVYFV